MPLSGSRWSSQPWVAADPANRARVNRDDLRAMFHDSTWLGRVTEQHVVAARDALITLLLARGVDVANDDTNLPSHTVQSLQQLAATAGAMIEIVDLTNVPVELCVMRDIHRARTVGSRVIWDFWDKHLRNEPSPLPIP